jgi:ferredoxin--NADP+ reductase
LVPYCHSKVYNKELNFLEADPYYDTSNMPMQLFKAKEPFVAKVVSVKKIIGPKAAGEICSIVLDHGGKMPYYEGQSYGVIPPGVNPKNSKPYANRLYSIASTRYGDDMKVPFKCVCWLLFCVIQSE